MLIGVLGRNILTHCRGRKRRLGWRGGIGRISGKALLMELLSRGVSLPEFSLVS